MSMQVAELGFSWPSSVDDVVKLAEDALQYRKQAEQVLHGDVSGALQVAIDKALPEYERRIKVYDPWLERQGRRAVRLAAAQMLPLLQPKPSQAEIDADTQPSAPTWVDRVVNPVKDPVVRGATDEAAKIAKPILLKVALVAAATMAVAFIAGRVSVTCH